MNVPLLTLVWNGHGYFILCLYRIDTIKTRLQSQAGFMASGGMRGVYSGLLAAVVGSAPSGKYPPPCILYTKRSHIFTLSYSLPLFCDLRGCKTGLEYFHRSHLYPSYTHGGSVLW